MEISKEEYELLKRKAKSYDDVVDAILKVQYLTDDDGNLIEEEGENVENPNCDVCAVGEAVLDELQMWM